VAVVCTVCEIHAESVFKIEGMDCHEEVAILEKRLKKLAGLEALDADVLSQRLKIKYDAAKLNTATIAEAVAQTGMRAWLEHEQPTGTAPSPATRRLFVVTSGLLVAAGMALEFAGVDRRLVIATYGGAIASGGVYSVRRALHARWCSGNGAKGRRSCSCSRWRSSSRRARWSGRAAPSDR
jgi:Zn2+/Cd2+-exporting ATPase